MAQWRLSLAGAGRGVGVIALWVTLGCLAAGCGTSHGVRPPARVIVREYVVPSGAMYIYSGQPGFRLLRRVPLPGVRTPRGLAVSPRTHTLYVSYGGWGQPHRPGRLLAIDLLTNQVRWRRAYGHGVDNMSIDPSGRRIYLPEGEDSTGDRWYVVDASNGHELGLIHGGEAPHETIVAPDGRRVYLAGTLSRYLDVASTATHNIVRRIGPFAAPVRPFTINAAQTVAYATETRRLGFQVASITTGRVLDTVGFGRGYRRDLNGSHTPSHGIGLTPDGRQLWVMDWPHHAVHVFDVSRVPQQRPREVATIRLPHIVSDGWIQMSLDGCFAYVGDSGDVLSTRTFTPVGYLPALNHTKQSIEVAWRRGRPVASSTRSGIGYSDRRVAALASCR